MVLDALSLPRKFDQDYISILYRVVDRWTRSLKDLILPIYVLALQAKGVTQDEDQSDLQEALNQSGVEGTALVLALTPDVSGLMRQVERWHSQRWLGTVAKGLDLDVSVYISPITAAPTLEVLLANNVSLIKGLDDDLRKQVSNLVWQGYLGNISRRNLARQLAAVLNSGKTRARFIVKDQLGKLAVGLDQLRMEEAGLDRYQWQTMEDDRVRPTHVANDGRVFLWRRPPATGHPGHEPGCRCKPRAIVKVSL